MRTSHLAIRRMIADKKGKLTDEQILHHASTQRILQILRKELPNAMAVPVK